MYKKNGQKNEDAEIALNFRIYYSSFKKYIIMMLKTLKLQINAKFI